jgi:hypothetical protein
MNPDVHAWLESLLGSPDPVERAHAAARMAMPHEIEPPPAATPPDIWTERIRACPDYQPGCCASPAPFCARYAVHTHRGRCVECLTASDKDSGDDLRGNEHIGE